MYFYKKKIILLKYVHTIVYHLSGIPLVDERGKGKSVYYTVLPHASQIPCDLLALALSQLVKPML